MALKHIPQPPSLPVRLEAAAELSQARIPGLEQGAASYRSVFRPQHAHRAARGAQHEFPSAAVQA